jgi:hypothetical protein
MQQQLQTTVWTSLGGRASFLGPPRHWYHLIEIGSPDRRFVLKSLFRVSEHPEVRLHVEHHSLDITETSRTVHTFPQDGSTRDTTLWPCSFRQPSTYQFGDNASITTPYPLQQDISKLLKVSVLARNNCNSTVELFVVTNKARVRGLRCDKVDLVPKLQLHFFLKTRFRTLN